MNASLLQGSIYAHIPSSPASSSLSRPHTTVSREPEVVDVVDNEEEDEYDSFDDDCIDAQPSEFAAVGSLFVLFVF